MPHIPLLIVDRPEPAQAVPRSTPSHDPSVPRGPPGVALSPGSPQSRAGLTGAQRLSGPWGRPVLVGRVDKGKCGEEGARPGYEELTRVSPPPFLVCRIARRVTTARRTS